MPSPIRRSMEEPSREKRLDTASSRSTRDVDSGPAQRSFRTIVRLWVPFLFLLVLVAFGAMSSDSFLTLSNIRNIVWASSVLGIVALGQTVLLITGKFDMSVAYSIGLVGVATVMAQSAGIGLFGSVVVGLLVGATVGVINGVIIVKTGANPFLITLGTGLFCYAVALTLTESKTLYVSIPAFNTLGRGQLLGIVPWSVVIFIGLAGLIQAVLTSSRHGHWLFAVGSDAEPSRRMGLPVRALVIVPFVLSGMLAATAALIMTARTNSTSASAGVGFDFESIMAAVLGGTSLFGGDGGTFRTVVGVLIIGVLNNILVLRNLPFESQQIAKGLLFITVVGLSGVLAAREGRGT